MLHHTSQCSVANVEAVCHIKLYKRACKQSTVQLLVVTGFINNRQEAGDHGISKGTKI